MLIRATSQNSRSEPTCQSHLVRAAMLEPPCQSNYVRAKFFFIGVFYSDLGCTFDMNKSIPLIHSHLLGGGEMGYVNQLHKPIVIYIERIGCYFY